jgi:hypothetical protein
MLYSPLSLYRLNIMACQKPCNNCNCKKSVYDSDYIEVDNSPLAKQQAAFLAQYYGEKK